MLPVALVLRFPATMLYMCSTDTSGFAWYRKYGHIDVCVQAHIDEGSGYGAIPFVT